LRDGQNLSVGSRIAAGLDGIVRGSDYLAADLDHGPDWHLVLTPRIDGLIEGQTHEKGVVAHQLRGEAFLERAGDRRGIGGHGSSGKP
jgi:hypothetical protein